MNNIKNNFNGSKYFEYIEIKDQDKQVSIMNANSIEILKINFDKIENSEIPKSINFLKKFTFIKWLTITAKKIDFEGLNLFNNLINLHIIEYSNNLIDFKGLKHLERLSLYYRKKINNFQDLKNLNYIEFTNFKEDDLSILQNINLLKTLKIARGNIKSLQGLNCSKLTYIDLYSCNKLIDLQQLEMPNKLKIIEITRCKNIKDLTFLNNCKSLEELKLIDCGDINSLQPLVKLKKLKKINFYGNTNILDGNFQGLEIKNLNFIERKHYSNKQSDFPKNN